MAFRRRGTPRGIRSGTGTEIYFEPDPDIFRTVGNVTGDMAVTAILGRREAAPEAAVAA